MTDKDKTFMECYKSHFGIFDQTYLFCDNYLHTTIKGVFALPPFVSWLWDRSTLLRPSIV